MKVKEIFYSLQGEGVYAGMSMVFIRFAGCGLIPKCSFCDTSFAWDPQVGRDMEVKDVLDEVVKLSPYRRGWLCITGGEPLWQGDSLEALVRELRKNGYKTTVETNGSFAPPSWYTLVDSWNADIKCPSSGVCGISNELWFHTRIQDQVKFVVSDSEDLKFARETINRHLAASPIVLVSPATGKLIDKKEAKIEEYWSKEWLREVAEFCKEMGVRYSLQLHKIIWGNRQGV